MEKRRYLSASEKARVTADDQWLCVPVGFWIVRGIKGELYPCESEIFAATYEPVTE